jgi:RimJ/RimL family protein N-acetyltransferase
MGIVLAAHGGVLSSTTTEILTSLSGRVTLPSGRVLDLYRSRWDGPLDGEEFEYCRQRGIPLSYDCAQIGWVTQTCTDDWIADPAPVDRPTLAAPVATVDPEQQAAQLRGVVAAEAKRVLADVRQGRISFDAAHERITSTAADELRSFQHEHGLSTSDLCHWALQSAVADALGTIRGPRHEPASPAGRRGVTFRPWTTHDAAVYLELLGNPRVWDYLPEPFPSPFTEDTARTLIEVAAIAFHHEAVAIEVDGRPIGQCLLRFDRPFAGARAAEVAYWLGERYWGQGWMSGVLPIFTARSFRNHRVDVIYAWISKDNEASIGAAQRAGFQRDSYPNEARLAESLGRPGFIRFATYRADWPD